ncbi:hypothetical protein [Nonomuraea salmonea]|uniref:hypothetical protein n=1 Tax=Nonomuraea salmonea TaxID=46181 RepID=UPI002FED2ECF
MLGLVGGVAGVAALWVWGGRRTGCGPWAGPNLAPGGVEFTFGRDYFCVPCASFSVRVPAHRLQGLLAMSLA